MSQATLHRLHLSISRNKFEKLLGGHWQTDKENRNLRRNGKWSTWTGPSKVVQGRTDKFVRNLRSGATRSGRSWRELAEALKLV